MGQTNNGWSGMLGQNIQPAPGSNPFFNLGTQPPVNNAFVTQVRYSLIIDYAETYLRMFGN